MRKGALQVSIGFIVVMVISALILIFALSWLGQMWSGMTSIGTYMTGQAQQKMMDELRGGNDVVLSTFPFSQEGELVERGKVISFMLGVKKDSEVEDYNVFTINIVGMNSDSSAVLGTDVIFTYRDKVSIVPVGGTDMIKVDMTISSKDTLKGKVYGFTAHVCKGNLAKPSSCVIGHGDYYGDTDFIIHVE
jgi:hypothetical protein